MQGNRLFVVLMMYTIVICVMGIMGTILWLEQAYISVGVVCIGIVWFVAIIAGILEDED